MSHTSETWKHGEEQITSEFPSGAVEIWDGSGYVVAYVPIHLGSSRYDTRKGWPRLIAAAPELLEALKTLRSFMWKEGYADTVPAMAKADVVISKATGGAE